MSSILRFKYWPYTCLLPLIPVYIPVASDKLKMKISESAIISADNFKILAGILSKPVALHAFRPLKVEATLSTCIGENIKKVSEDWLKV